ncbi:uncharacterized protein LOC127091693 [Lathyrus oleraceus]|uniref:uncharacterized protein LOC127091693 n=1 Tax=Pisum sativum TaxID=3888 RepID=UPI0021D3CA3D|nr:uncharacterized protein LOC127091693 [Pisum sativum]
MDDTIFISQSKYVKNIVKKFGLESASHKRTLATTHLKLTKDEKGVDVDQSLYRSMIGSLLYLTTSRLDITFNVGLLSIDLDETNAKGINVKQDVMTLYYNNLSAINISKNPIQHRRTKHIDIRYHFIRDLVEDKIVTLEHVTTEKKLADIFTKALDENQFEKLRGELGICMLEML